MFPTISVTEDFEKLVGWARRTAPDQVAFATAVALTRTGQDSKRAVEREMSAVFDRPTPYTMRGFRLYPATKKKLEARLGFRLEDRARDYLGPQILGGQRKIKAFEKSLMAAGLLPRGFNAVPGAAAKLDQFGNMARSQIVQILSYFQAFGEQGYRANMTDKRKASLAKRGVTADGYKVVRGVEYFVSMGPGEFHGRQQHLPRGIWARSGIHGSAVSPVVMFVRASSYTKRMRFLEVVQDTINQRLRPQFWRAWGEATASARRP